MTRVQSSTRSKLLRRTAPFALVAILGVGAAACGSSSKASHTQSPGASTPATAPPSTASQSGGAGF